MTTTSQYSLFYDNLAVSESIQDPSELISQYDNTLQDNPNDREAALLKSNVLAILGNDVQSFETIAYYLANVSADVQSIKNDVESLQGLIRC